MNDVTRVLSAIEQGDPTAAGELLPLVYDELRRLAKQRLAQEKPGQTLQATALVHEAYLRLVGGQTSGHWDSRRHFFAAAAEAMRRILVENARRKKRLRHGGSCDRVELDEALLCIQEPSDDTLAIDEALEALVQVDAQAAELVKLRFFAGLSTEEAAQVLGLPERTAYREWSFAKAWLFRHLKRGEGDDRDATPA
jgi:RNA polymerase sigma factor (TIGR02999 family)